MKIWEEYDKKRIMIFLGSIMLLISVAFCIFLLFKVNSLEKTVDELKNSLYGSHVSEELASESGSANGLDTLYRNASDESYNSGQNMSSDSKSAGNDLADELADDSEDGSEIEVVDLDDLIKADPYEGRIKVYLTFDDGPSNNTDKILDILSDYGVKATFFVNGREKFDNQYKRIVDEGHTIGMHSYSHDYRKVYGSLDTFAEDLYDIQSLIYEKTGVTPEIYRFPGGSSNSVSNMKMSDAITYLNAKAINYYDWNVSAQDAIAGGASTTDIISNVVNAINNGEEESYIVLMHDCDDKNNTVEALPVIIEKLADMENIVILPIDENTTAVQHVTVD